MQCRACMHACMHAIACHIGAVVRRFEDLLRGITLARPDICDAMVFALDNAECASEARVRTHAYTGNAHMPSRMSHLRIYGSPKVHACAAVATPSHTTMPCTCDMLECSGSARARRRACRA